MRAPSPRVGSFGPLVVACALGGGLACGNGTTPVQAPPDGARSDAADAATDADALDDARVAETASDRAVAETEVSGDGAGGGGADLAAEAPAGDALGEAAAEGPADLAAEKQAATASWTIAPNPMCTAAGAGCMDTGAVGGYEITASGVCPLASDVQLWFPGGAAPLAAGTYAVKVAAGILDVIAMPAGMVGVLAERDDSSTTHSRYWGRAGTVTVTATGSERHVTLMGVSLREETSSAMTTLGADVTCP